MGFLYFCSANMVMAKNMFTIIAMVTGIINLLTLKEMEKGRIEGVSPLLEPELDDDEHLAYIRDQEVEVTSRSKDRIKLGVF